MFKRQESTARPAGTTPAGYSVLDAQMVVRGDLESDGMLRIDGRLEGNIKRASVVVLGEHATIVGNVAAREMVLGGTITGNVVAEQRVEVEATAVVEGDIEADAILIHEGGAVRGRLHIRPRVGGAAEREKVTVAEPGKGKAQLQLSAAVSA